MIRLRRLSLAFVAGMIGALVSSAVLWASARYGIAALLHVGIAPVFSDSWLYPRLIVGGLWGSLLLLPLRRGLLLRGVLISLPPTLVQLLWIFPVQAGLGWFGTELGVLTPVYSWAVWLIWGWIAVLWARATGQ